MGSSICKLAVLLLLQAAAPTGREQVSGQVVRPGVRRMDPVSGAWVVLHRVGPDHAGPLDSLRSDSRGRYSFRYTRSGSEDAIYFVSAVHGGIAYFTPPLAEGRVGGDAGEIAVFDTTSRHVPISVRGHHVVVSGVDANALRSVVEVYDLSNDSSVTRVAANDRPEGATWRARVVPGATNFRVTQSDIPTAAVSYANGLVTVFAPLAPGVKQVSFSYSLPAKAFPLSLPLEARTSIYEILIEEKGGKVSGPNIREVEPVSVEARSFRRFLASDMPENSVALIDLPSPPPPLARAVNSLYLVALTLVLGGAMIFALARALRRR